jgi:hypothetical protein
MVVLYGLGLLLTILLIMRALHTLFIVIALQFGTTIALLAFPPSVSAFINYQRQKYKKATNTPPEPH